MAPAIVRLLTPKWTVFSSWACDCFYVAANFYPTWLTLIPASALTGAMTGPLWTTKDLYVSQMARESVLSKNAGFDTKYQEVLSFYNGIVFAGFSLASVVGQLISSAVLAQSPFVNRSSVCGAFNCQEDSFLEANITNVTISARPEKSLVYILLGVLLSFVILAIILVVAFLQQIPSQNQNVCVKSTLTSCARRVTDSSMLLMIPQIVFFAFYQGIIQADYTKSYITCGVGVGMVGYVMVCRGIAATLASVVCGRLVKYTGRPLQACGALLGYMGTTAMLWLWKPSQDNLGIFFIVPVLFGISEVVFQTHICTVLAIMFKDDSPAAFANFYTFRAFSKALSFGLSGFVCVWIKLAVVSSMLLLACGSFVVLECRLKSVKPPSKDGAVLEVMLEQQTPSDLDSREEE
ncbi:protein unc-93 homolog A-like [Liolophura sinensis]|uniref:protein unc-93 homolog A-like n=1 Tax=Liolophura sinensis TaxID=3198878 RepID=UPI0031596188